ncbi:uncharacterized protein [Mytilus edulis]|uniref:uncharacterized protein n=1 Tax=Mytilus edulis TaxID=6550 RepID=UPI0039EDEABF
MAVIFIIFVYLAVNTALTKGDSDRSHHYDDISNRVKDDYIVNIEMHATAKEMNCSKHCIKCDTHGECIGCEVGFYGSTCESRCLLDCGTRGCQQNTGKCNGTPPGSSGNTAIYIGAGVGGGILVLLLTGCVCRCTLKRSRYSRI